MRKGITLVTQPVQLIYLLLPPKRTIGEVSSYPNDHKFRILCEAGLLFFATKMAHFGGFL